MSKNIKNKEALAAKALASFVVGYPAIANNILYQCGIDTGGIEGLKILLNSPQKRKGLDLFQSAMKSTNNGLSLPRKADGEGWGTFLGQLPDLIGTGSELYTTYSTQEHEQSMASAQQEYANTMAYMSSQEYANSEQERKQTLIYVGVGAGVLVFLIVLLVLFKK